MTCEMFYGTITAARAPEDPQNVNGYQYEYDVDCEGDVGNKVPLRHVVKADAFGSQDEFDDATLRPGSRVMVLCPSGNYNAGVIICALRNNPTKMGQARSSFTQKRFNKVTQTVDSSGHWTLQLDQGEFLKVDKQFVTLDNSTGESIVFDKQNKTILVKAGKDWQVNLGANMLVTAAESVTINCKNATVKATENVQVSAAKKLLADCDTLEVTVKSKAKITTADAEVNASGKVKIKGGSIDLNDATSAITTEQSHQFVIDLITNVPVLGVKTIKAG